MEILAWRMEVKGHATTRSLKAKAENNGTKKFYLNRNYVACKS